MFCAATGFAGTPKVGTGRFEPERLVPVEGARRIKVHFNADRSEQLPWKFTPQQKFVSVLPGETSLAFYTAKNTSTRDIIGIATYNVTPDRVSDFFFLCPNHTSNGYSSRLHLIFRKWNASVSRSRGCWLEKKLTCHCYFSSTKICLTIQLVGMWRTLFYRTPSSGELYISYCYVLHFPHQSTTEREETNMVN